MNLQSEEFSIERIIGEFNPFIFFKIFKKSILYVLFILFIFSLGAYLYQKYTAPVYESTAVLLLKKNQQTKLLGVNQLFGDDISEINRQIQVLKSNLVIRKVVEKLPFEISYFKQGRTNLVHTEFYPNSPFIVQMDSNAVGGNFYDNPIYVDFNQTDTCHVLCEALGLNQNVPLNELFSINGQGSFLIRRVAQGTVGKYFFVINSPETLENQIKKDLQIAPLNRQETVNIKIKSNDPEKARDILNILIQEFIFYDKERKAKSVENVLSFLDKQIEVFGSDFYQYQDTVKRFMSQNGFVAPDKQIGLLLKKIEVIDKTKEQMLLQKAVFEWIINQLKEQKGVDLIPISIDDRISSFFLSKIETIKTLEARKKELLIDVKPGHPEVLLIDNQIQTSKNKLLNEIIRLDKDKSKEIESIQIERQRLIGDLYKLPDKEAEFSRLTKESDIQENFFLNLIEKKSQYLIAKASIVSDFIVLQQARLTLKPVLPDRQKILILGPLLGLLVSLLFLFFRYLRHTKINSVAEIEERTNISVIGSIPAYSKKMDVSQVVVLRAPKSRIAESFRTVRSNLQFLDNSFRSKTVLVTSTIPGEGKTFVGINLAAIITMLNKKVIMLDLDLRKPRLHKVFNIQSRHGVSTVLSRQSTLEEAIHRTKYENLDVIVCGVIPPNPSELILSDYMHEVIKELHTKYDYVFIDSPPIGLVTDTLALMPIIDYPIYVVRPDYSERQFIDYIDKVAKENNISKLSIVVNHEKPSGSNYIYDESASGYYSE